MQLKLNRPLAVVAVLAAILVAAFSYAEPVSDEELEHEEALEPGVEPGIWCCSDSGCEYLLEHSACTASVGSSAEDVTGGVHLPAAHDTLKGLPAVFENAGLKRVQMEILDCEKVVGLNTSFTPFRCYVTVESSPEAESVLFQGVIERGNVTAPIAGETVAGYLTEASFEEALGLSGIQQMVLHADRELVEVVQQ